MIFRERHTILFGNYTCDYFIYAMDQRHLTISYLRETSIGLTLQRVRPSGSFRKTKDYTRNFNIILLIEFLAILLINVSYWLEYFSVFSNSYSIELALRYIDILETNFKISMT